MPTKKKNVSLSVKRWEKSKKWGLTEKGRKKYNKATWSKLKAPVTWKVKAWSKAAKRRKSFCARMSWVKWPMKDSKWKPTRKALALKRWKCKK